MLELVRLRALAAVPNMGQSVAARDLHYAQPSISHHLARLEADVGVPLTQRVGRRIRLTPAGELLSRRAVEILGRIRSAQEELAAIAELRMGKVRVAAFRSALSTVVTRAGVFMKASAPGIEPSLTEVHSDVALSQLREEAIDVGVVFRYDDTCPTTGSSSTSSTTRCTSLAGTPGRLSPSTGTPPGLPGATDAGVSWSTHARPRASRLGSCTPATSRSFNNRW